MINFRRALYMKRFINSPLPYLFMILLRHSHHYMTTAKGCGFLSFNKTSESGGGVEVSGTFTMEGGTISGNTGVGTGGDSGSGENNWNGTWQ